MNIVEQFSYPVGKDELYAAKFDIAATWIGARLKLVGNYRVLPNVFDYPHGATKEIDFNGLKIMQHHYTEMSEKKQPVAEQYELSIEYELI